jgi:hypothetical protein
MISDISGRQQVGPGLLYNCDIGNTLAVFKSFSILEGHGLTPYQNRYFLDIILSILLYSQGGKLIA